MRRRLNRAAIPPGSAEAGLVDVTNDKPDARVERRSPPRCNGVADYQHASVINLYDSRQPELVSDGGM